MSFTGRGTPKQKQKKKKIKQILKELTLYAGCPRRNSEEHSEKSKPVDDRTNWNEWQQAGDIAFYRQPDTTPREAPPPTPLYRLSTAHLQPPHVCLR